MSKTKRNHYLSQCISKNFAVGGSNTFWEYNCMTKSEVRPKNIRNLFSDMRLWGQELEDALSNEYENELSIYLKELNEKYICQTVIPGRYGLEAPQFYIEEILDDKVKKTLSKLWFQILLIQLRNADTKDITNEKIIKSLYATGVDLKMQVGLVELNKRVNYPPLILVDVMAFAYFVPEYDVKTNTKGYVCWMMPISPTRFLIWGNKQDILYFCKKYNDIDYLNLCRIAQQGKQCRIATQNYDYLESLIPQINSFNSGNNVVKIESVRNL